MQEQITFYYDKENSGCKAYIKLMKLETLYCTVYFNGQDKITTLATLTPKQACEWVEEHLSHGYPASISTEQAKVLIDLLALESAYQVNLLDEILSSGAEKLVKADLTFSYDNDSYGQVETLWLAPETGKFYVSNESVATEFNHEDTINWLTDVIGLDPVNYTCYHEGDIYGLLEDLKMERLNNSY
jgi:hypothetical protein